MKSYPYTNEKDYLYEYKQLYKATDHNAQKFLMRLTGHKKDLAISKAAYFEGNYKSVE
jgi:hypothetical protein